MKHAVIVLARHNDGVEFAIESIATGGARLAGPLTLAVGENIQLLFEVAGRPVDVQAEVIRVERQDIMTERVAVSFRNVSDTTHELIHQLVVSTLDELG